MLHAFTNLIERMVPTSMKTIAIASGISIPSVSLCMVDISLFNEEEFPVMLTTTD